ncbi:MFS transporter [Pandoraea soli]|uniref:MFS transporter n=1 Tax=Pandoraea soli TaxID=2508293 RepID=A0ABY6VYF2_9BURK|nr:MFS transporter [Pandoraea soli]VVE04036.1 MFS transporter [Pandoraea soli]
MTHNAKSHNPWREICAASIGNALEFYDLLIYGYFAIVIGQLFFPAHDATTSLLLSVGTFGISFVTRPLGSIILGSYADRAGRKASLTVSIALMMLGTALLADIFPTSTRGTGLALSYNFSVTLFGGFAPLIVTWLIDATHNKLAPSFYVMTTAVLSVGAVISLGRRVREGKIAGVTHGSPRASRV